jgi:hypothetical protein
VVVVVVVVMFRPSDLASTAVLVVAFHISNPQASFRLATMTFPLQHCGLLQVRAALSYGYTFVP